MKKTPPFQLNLVPLSQEAQMLAPFKWADPKIGQRHKIGGSPEFIQDEEWPICRDCRKKMSFYAQLDSLNDEFCIGDCGMIYVFICWECNEVESIIQSY